MGRFEDILEEMIRDKHRRGNINEAWRQAERSLYTTIEETYPTCMYRTKRTAWVEPGVVRITQVEPCKLLLSVHPSTDLTLDQIKGCFVKFYQKNKL